MAAEEMDPPVKSGNGDLPVITADGTAFGTAYLIKPDAGQCEVK